MAKCNCDYKKGVKVYRSGSGHRSSCPVHLEHLEKQRKQMEKKDGK